MRLCPRGRDDKCPNGDLGAEGLKNGVAFFLPIGMSKEHPSDARFLTANVYFFTFMNPLKLKPSALLGTAQQEGSESLIAEAIWYNGKAINDGLDFRFPIGSLAEARYLTADLLADGNCLPVFILHFQEGENGPKFGMTFGTLNQCSARLRIPLDCVNQNRWLYDREGAWLKPLCFEERVDLNKVDRMTLTIYRKSAEDLRWCITPFTATAEEPPKLRELVLPKGPLLDELGQSTLREWPAKSRSAEEVIHRLHAQLAAAPLQQSHADFSQWGGWKKKHFEATGFFRTHHDGQRWWLVDPEGYVFWSAGVDCFGFGRQSEGYFENLDKAFAWIPEQSGEYAEMFSERDGVPEINFFRANFIRAFGAGEAKTAWSKIALSELRRLRFNTIANWSDWRVAREAGFPYVRPLDLQFRHTPTVFRDFPDVFHPGFAVDAAALGEQLRETCDDPAFIGYFLMNEPTWGFAEQTPAEGMWFNSPESAACKALVEFVAKRHSGEPNAEDFTEFSTLMVEKLYSGLSAACRAVDPNHLNLGARYYTVPPGWALAGMRCFDIFSVNCYSRRVHAGEFEKISTELGQPVIVGEWHFGALDAGLPATGIGHVGDQVARGQAYRTYIEDAASKPWCVGTHWFTLYDQSAIGRFDGENYNIGFFDVCNRPYEALSEAARLSHERIYEIASGKLDAYNGAPDYRPLVCM